MWFKVHRNVNDIRKQIIAFIKKHIMILFTHKSIHNSDRKGIKYWMSYPRWSTSLVVNKQFWSDQSAVDQNETSKRSNDLWSHHLTLIQTLENVQRRAARFVINDYTSRTQWCVTSMLTSLEWQTLEQRRSGHRPRLISQTWWQQNQRSTWVLPGEVQLWHSQKLLPKNSTGMEPPTRHHGWGQLHRGVQG
jgi:hypothetical protein